MFHHVKDLQFNARVSRPDPRFANLLLEQFGGKNGELACDPNARNKTLGNSKDTTSVNKAGGPPISYTATINKGRRDSAKLPAKPNTTKGNADLSGHIKNQ